MPSTTNFGWTTPADTDLVKDGASAIRTLGNGIDTSFVDLKGGTTGQVLSKNSNTDLDFIWVAQDDSNAIQNALLTTTGDTIYASAASTPARLGIGTTGQVLTVSGGVPAWTTISSGGMTLLSTTTLSGASTTISSIDQTYVNLYGIVVGVTNATGNGALRMRPNGSTTITSRFFFDTNNTGPGYVTESSDFFLSNDQNTAGLVNRNSSNNAFSFQIFNYASTTNYKPFNVTSIYERDTGTNKNPFFEFGGFFTNTAISSLVFANTGGNFSSGTVLLYGVK